MKQNSEPEPALAMTCAALQASHTPTADYCGFNQFVSDGRGQSSDSPMYPWHDGHVIIFNYLLRNRCCAAITDQEREWGLNLYDFLLDEYTKNQRKHDAEMEDALEICWASESELYPEPEPEPEPELVMEVAA